MALSIFSKKVVIDHLENLIVFGHDSQLSICYPKTARYYYFLLLERFIKILDTTHWMTDVYVNVSSDLNDVFVKISKALDIVEARLDIEGLAGFNFRLFSTLYQDQDYLRSNWRIHRPQLLATMQNLTKDYFQSNFQYHPYPIPLEMAKVFDDLDSLLIEFKNHLLQYRTRVRPFSWDEIAGTFEIRGQKMTIDPGSKRCLLFDKLIRSLGQELPLSSLGESAKDQARIRTAINQIRSRITSAGLGDIVKIFTNKNSGYTLTIFQA